MTSFRLWLNRVLWFLLSHFLLSASILFAQPPGQIIQIVHPLDNTEIISKKLTVQGRFLTPIQSESFMLLLDGIDLTGLVEFGTDGFSCSLIDILPSGEHTIYIAVQSDGELFEHEITFLSRHHASYEELYSNNTLSMDYGAALTRSLPSDSGNIDDNFIQNNAPSGNAAGVPYSKIDAYLVNESILKKGGFDISFSGDLRYLDQNEEVRKPEKRGFDLVNFKLKADYLKNYGGFYSDFGDIQINQSVNTLENLARRGGQLNLQYKDIFINTFTILGKETFSFTDGIGVGFDSDENIMGVTAGINIFQNRVGLKTLYISGSDQQNSYNSWSQEGGDGKGDVIGFILNSNLFSDKLYTEFEYDESDYDSDDADEYSSDRDKAYRLLFGGLHDIYSYDIIYEHFGPFYNVPGANSLRKDYQGVTATGFMEHEIHSLNGSLSGYHDNVDSDPYYSRVNSLYGTLDYNYYGFETVVLGFEYAKGVDRSSDEPEEALERRLYTDIFGLNLGYIKGSFSLDFYGLYSNQNDRSKEDIDADVATITISPSYALETFSVYSSFSLNQSDDHSTDVRTDTYTVTLDLLGSLFQERVTYELGGTYDQTKSTDDFVDTNGITGYCRIGYHLPQSFWNRLNASVSLEANYNNRENQFGAQNGEEQLGDQDEEIHSVVLSFSASLPYSL